MTIALMRWKSSFKSNWRRSFNHTRCLLACLMDFEPCAVEGIIFHFRFEKEKFHAKTTTSLEWKETRAHLRFLNLNWFVWCLITSSLPLSLDFNHSRWKILLPIYSVCTVYEEKIIYENPHVHYSTWNVFNFSFKILA